MFWWDYTSVLIWSCLINLYNNILYYPLRNLYLKGPMLYGYGFWGGKTIVNICSEITTVKSELWIKNLVECEEIIDNHVNSFILGVLWIFGIIAFYYIIGALWYKYMIINPVLHKIETLLKTQCKL